MYRQILLLWGLMTIFAGGTAGAGTRLCWATDIHLDAASASAYAGFVEKVKALEPDLILITGDIAEGPSLVATLDLLCSDLPVPLAYIMGNHDYYGRAVAVMRDEAASFERACYLTAQDEPIALSDTAALIGHDGWADGQAGDFLTSPIRLRDYNEIADLAGVSDRDRLETLRQLGAEAAAVLRERLHAALVDYDLVVLAIHAPPYVEACLYAGEKATPAWSPHFVSQQCGQMCLEVMAAQPDKELLILCGHTHHQADYRPLPNLRVLVGKAEYGDPLPQQVFVFE